MRAPTRRAREKMDRDHMLRRTMPVAPDQPRNHYNSSTDTAQDTMPKVPDPSNASQDSTNSLRQDLPPISTFSQTVPPTYSRDPYPAAAGHLHANPLVNPQDNGSMILPPISTVTSVENMRGRGSVPQANPASQWPPVNPIAFHPHSSVDSAASTVMDVDSRRPSTSATSPDRYGDGRAPSVNLDDPDVRLAAEALGDLRADFVSSPPMSTNAPPAMPPPAALPRTKSTAPHQEPLFNLLTTSHPFLATTLGGASSAYGGAKNYSPRFKSSAEYVENYLTPIANTVGSVGRVTGVEGSVRWFLGAGRRSASSSSDVEAGNSKKRRKLDPPGEQTSSKRLDSEAMKQLASSQPDFAPGDIFPPTPKSRRMSTASTVDTLPAYDDQRSPAYTESAQMQQSGPSSNGTTPNGHWQSRLAITTSGLGVAMSDESLRSLKYCLTWLKWANQHMGGVIGSLKTTLDQYDSHNGDQEMSQIEASERQQEEADTTPQNGETHEQQQLVLVSTEQTRTELAARIHELKGDLLKTLQDTINTVSKYAGGALPTNARNLVRSHLTSLPQRFRLASVTQRSDSMGSQGSQDSDSAVREGAQRVLVLAKEGLDMVSQVSGVLDGTIVSAEEWCERMGKRKAPGEETPLPTQEKERTPHAGREGSGDVKMG